MSDIRLPEKRRLSFFSLWQPDKERQKNVIYIIITHSGWDLKGYPVSPKHQWPTEIAQFLFLRCTGLCTHTLHPSACLLLNKSNQQYETDIICGLWHILTLTSLFSYSAVNRFFFLGLYSQMETRQICLPILHFPSSFTNPPPLQSVYLFSPTGLSLCQSY